VALSIVYPTGDPVVEDELRRLRTALPKGISLVVGGAAASAYSTVLEDIGADRIDSLADFRAELQALRRARRRAG